MSKTSFLVGLAFSLLIHGVFLMTATPREKRLFEEAKGSHEKFAVNE